MNTKSNKNELKIDTGVRYSDEIKEMAFQLWAFKYAENAAEVCRALNEGRFGDPVPVTPQIVQYWARNGWAERKHAEAREQYGPILERIFNENVYLSLELITKFRRQIANDEAIDKVEASLYAQLSDRIGIPAIAKADTVQILNRHQPSAKELPDSVTLAKMSPEELQAEEARFRDKRTT